MLGRRRVPDGVAGVAQLHALVGDHAAEPSLVVVGIELDRGLLVGALTAAGYQVVAVNPLAASRYRERHATSGAKSDPGDAKVLADLVRTDRHNHRLVAGDTEGVEAIWVLARAHQSAIWSRQRQLNSPRSALRGFYPAALEAFGRTWPAAMRWQCCRSRPPRSWAASFPGPRSLRHWAAAAASATSKAGRPRSRPRWAPPSWPRPNRSATPTDGGPGHHCRGGQPQPADRHVGGGAGRGGSTRTRTPRPSAPCQDWGWSWAPGCWASSAMTKPDSPPPSLARTMPAAHLSPRPRAARWWCSPATPATAAWPMRWTSWPSARSPAHRARRYYDLLRARNKTHRQALRQLANRWSASSTPAWNAASSMTNTSPGATSNPRLLDSFHTSDV